jgi:hypothetical protein
MGRCMSDLRLRNDIGAPFPQRKEQSLRDELKNAAYADLTEQGYLPTSKTDDAVSRSGVLALLVVWVRDE